MFIVQRILLHVFSLCISPHKYCSIHIVLRISLHAASLMHLILCIIFYGIHSFYSFPAIYSMLYILINALHWKHCIICHWLYALYSTHIVRCITFYLLLFFSKHRVVLCRLLYAYHYKHTPNKVSPMHNRTFTFLHFCR